MRKQKGFSGQYVLAGAFLCLVLLFGGAAGAWAQGAPGVLLILDASGSMWGDAGGEIKIEAARKVLEEVIPDLPDKAELGLMFYGHRRKGDCKDVEILYSLGQGEKEAMLGKIRTVKPRGKTPLTASLLLAGEELKTREEATTVILVSDGRETCGGDPCETVKKLKALGISFVLHVVGFQVDEEARAQLSCMAEAGEGTYFDAADAPSLREAMKEVQKDVEVQVEQATVQRTPLKGGLGKLRLVFPGESSGNLKMVEIYRKKDGKKIKTVEDPEAESLHPLPAGEYELKLGFALPNYKDPIVLPGGTFTLEGGSEEELLFGALGFSVPEELEKTVAEVSLKDPETGEVLAAARYEGNGYYLFRSKPLLGESCDVEFRYFQSETPVMFFRGAGVEKGKELFLPVDTGIRLVEAPDAGVQAWHLYPAGEETPLLSVKRRWDNNFPLWRGFAVPPGTYDLSVEIKGMDEPLPVLSGLEVAPHQLVEVDTGL